MKFIWICMYAIYLLLFLDSLSVEAVLQHGFTTIQCVYAFALIILYICELRRDRFLVMRKQSLLIYAVIVLFYICEAIRPASDVKTAIRLLTFLTIAYFNAVLAQRYKALDELLITFYLVSFAFITVRFFGTDNPFEAYQHLSGMFNQQRYRVAFGFYHYNGAGHLATCLLILSVYIWNEISGWMKQWRAGAMKLAILIMDFIVLSFLLASASRTCILTIFIFIAICVYFRIDTLCIRDVRCKILFRSLSISMMVGIFVLVVWDIAVSFFISSNRMRNFKNLLPLLDEPKKVLFGLSVQSPSYFFEHDAVDNYYLYLLLTVGVLGLVVIGSQLFLILKRLWCNFMNERSNINKYMLAILICHLIAGFSENCVLFYLFPSSVMYFTLYFYYCNQPQLNS